MVGKAVSNVCLYLPYGQSMRYGDMGTLGLQDGYATRYSFGGPQLNVCKIAIQGKVKVVCTEALTESSFKGGSAHLTGSLDLSRMKGLSKGALMCYARCIVKQTRI